MMSLNKLPLLLFIFSIVAIPSVASENLKKDKKALIEYIKRDYYSWSATAAQDGDFIEIPTQDFANRLKGSSTEMQQANRARAQNHGDQTPKAHQQSKDFGDFQCTIVNCQAIVRFSVDEQMISAFFEKENGEWKLICAAQIDNPS